MAALGWASIYQILGSLASLPIVGWSVTRGRFGGRWADRLGLPLAGGGRPLWIHGASVGEARSAYAIIEALTSSRPRLPFVLSVGTPAGLSLAETLISGSKTQLTAPPLDFWGAPGRFLDRVDPIALVLVETEIWPGLIRAAHKRNIPVMLVAGRISQRSFARYQIINGFMTTLLSNFKLVATITTEDRDRFVKLGSPPDQTRVFGSPKFDRLIEISHKPQNHPRTLLVAGSTHPGEESLILRAAAGFLTSWPLVLAPRHLTRVPEVMELVQKEGFSVQLWSQADQNNFKTQVLVLDRLGLDEIYQKAVVALVGGSFLPGAGHNPLEPVAFKTPVIFGPYMSSFAQEARALIAAGAARSCLESEIHQTLAEWLGSDAALSKASQAGLAGQKFLSDQDPVSPILAQAIITALADSQLPKAI